MPPLPAPTPETAPALENSLVNKTVVDSLTNVYLGDNVVVKGDSIQSSTPFITSDAVWSNGYNVLPGSTASYILRADNLTIDKAGNLTKVGAITSTGNSTFSGSVTAGSLSTTGSLSANSVVATSGFTTTSGNFTTSVGTVSTKELSVAGTKFSVDSLAGTLSLTGTLTSTGVSITTGSTFQIDSSTGTLKTQGTITAGGNISTTGAATITAAGALNGASLNIAGTAFKVDNLGAITGSKYYIDKDGNLSHDGTLTTKSSASLANGGFLLDVNGNITKAGTIASKAVSVSGSLTTTEGITVGSGAILLSNNGTSTFKNSMNLGANPASGTIYPIMLNAADGSASFASGKGIIGADGSMSLLNGATLVNSDGVKLGVTSTNGTASNKIELNSSSGNATFAGQASFLGGAATLTNTGLTMLGGDVSVRNISGTGLLNVGGAATLSSGLTVTGASTFNGAATLSNTLAVTGATTLSSTLALTGAATLSNTLAVAGVTTLSSTLAVTGAATLSSTLALTGDLSVNTDKFKVTASNGNLTSKGSLTMDGVANFANNQIQLKSDGSLYALNYFKTDFDAYVKNDIVDDKTITEPLVKGSPLYIQKFNSTTNKYLTTQEYVDSAIHKQATRLNLITKDVDTQLATFQNIGKVLAAMEGPDGINPLTAVNGLVDEVQDVKVSIADLMGGGYNSVLVNCNPNIWGDGAAPQLIPASISSVYKEDGWFYSSVSTDSYASWNVASYDGMKIKDVTNLFMNLFLLSSKKLPKLSVYTAPKNDSSDAINGIYNAKIDYYFEANSPSAPIAQRSCLYVISSPKNIYSDRSYDMRCKYSMTTNGTGSPNKITFTPSTTFLTSFDTSKVNINDSILTFSIEATDGVNVNDYMYILQNIAVSRTNGTTQFVFQNSAVATNYLFQKFYKKNIDFSDYDLRDSTVSTVNKNNYNAYVASVKANTLYPVTATTSPQSHVTGFRTLSIGGTLVTNNSQIITFPAGTPSALLVCDLENNNNSLVITKNGVPITPANTVGDYSPTTPIPLITGDNIFVVTEKDKANDHTKATTFNAKVLSNDTKLSSVTMNGQSITLVSGAITANTVKNVPAGTTTVTVVGTPTSSSATVLVTGATGLHVGDNTVTVKVTAGDATTIANNSFVVHVPSDDTSLSTFTVNGTGVVNGSTVELPPGTTAVSVVAVATAASSGASRTISGSSVIPGNNTLTVLVTAESGATRTYTVTLKVLDGNTNLGSLVINTLPQDMNASKFTFASTTTGIAVDATAASSSATVSISGIPTGSAVVVPGTTYKLKITVTAQNKASKDYEYDVRVQSNDNTIDSVYINSLPLQFNGNNIVDVTSVASVAPNSLSLQVNEASAATLTYKIENDGPTQSITSGVSKTVSIQRNNVSQIFVTINPEDTAVSSKTYTINVYSRSNNTSLSGITVTPLNGTTSSVNNGGSITLDSGVNSVTVNASAGYSGAVVNIDGEIGTNSSSKTFTVESGRSKVVPITVTATDGVTQNSYSVTIVAPDNTPVLNNDTSLKLLSTKGYGQIIADNTIVNIINTSGFATGIYSKSIDLDTSFILINPTVDPISDPAFSSQKGIIIFATPTNKNATTTCSLSTELTKNEVISFAYVYVTSSDGSATQTYTVKLIRNSILSDNSSLITLGTNTSYKSEVTIDDSINSILLNPSPGEVMYTGQIALKTPALNANVSVNLVDGISIGDGNGNFTSTKNLTTYATKNKIQLEFTLDGNSTKYYQTMYLIRSSGYASLDTLLNSNDLTLPFAAATSIMTSATNGTIQKFGFALSNTKYTLKSGPTSPSFTGPKIYIVASYDEGLNWSLLKYSNANDSSFSFLGSGTLPQSNSIVYNNNNENTVLSLNNTYYLIFNRNDQYFSKSLTTSYVSASTSASGFIKSSSTFLSTYYNVLYLSRVVDVNVSYDYYAIVLNNNTDYGRNIFIMARQVGNSALKPLSIVVQCGSTTSGYIFGDSPTISKVTINNIDYFQVVTVGGSIANSVPSGTYRTMISSLTSTMNGLTYTTSSNNVIALIAISSDATVSSLGWFDSASNYGTLNAPTTSEQVTLTQGATGFGINVGRDSKATISAKVDGVDVTCNSDGIQDLIPITPGSTVSVVITVTAQNGTTTSSYTVNVTSPAPL